jgi:hypothetical protein
MLKTHYFYLWLPERELQTLIDTHQEEFDLWLGDTFSENELTHFEPFLDGLGAVSVQPMLDELRFDDLNSDETDHMKQNAFFESCQSQLCLENLPYFESNPFQVSYLIQLLNRFGEVLIDVGDDRSLMFKKAYLSSLDRYKKADHFITSKKEPLNISTKKPVHPIDFIILDVYKELDRLSGKSIVLPDSEKLQKIYQAMNEKGLDADKLLKKSGLIPKDFGDQLERLKFTLKKIT